MELTGSNIAFKSVCRPSALEKLSPWQDVSLLEFINAAIKPVADLTYVLSGEKYVTVPSVKPVFELLEDTKATILDPRCTMEDAKVLDDVTEKLLQELLDMN